MSVHCATEAGIPGTTGVCRASRMRVPAVANTSRVANDASRLLAIPAPDDRGYILRYDLDAEHMNAGFWPGDDDDPEPRLYGYLVPRPDGCEIAPIEPSRAAWAEAMGEWILPYEHVRSSKDPRATIVDFLQSVYKVAITSGGWDADAHTYAAPVKPERH
jgi:Family of unknown function (DUF5996)